MPEENDEHDGNDCAVCTVLIGRGYTPHTPEYGAAHDLVVAEIEVSDIANEALEQNITIPSWEVLESMVAEALAILDDEPRTLN